MSRDRRFMRRALRLAARGWGRTSPNPLVGAVITDGEHELGAGWHRKAGDPHAEINALQDAGKQACGASLYVTLEPCSSQGRTPPCTDAIVAAGVKRVVIGSLDPNPNHAGRAVSLLEQAGIRVVSGVEEDRCQELNEAFNCWIRYRRPYVLLKLAMTLDGKIATVDGDSQWISGPQSRRYVQKLRQWADAILVGAETVRRDDPQLLVRRPKNWPRQPLRLIASRSGDLGTRPQVLHDGMAQTKVIQCADKAAWQEELHRLGTDGVSALLVEGGGELAGELLWHELIDKVVIFVAPKLLGGRHSRPVIGGPDRKRLTEALSLSNMNCVKSGDDYRLTGYLNDVHRYS